MRNYIYELLQVPTPANEWTSSWDYQKHPDAFPIADTVDEAKDRDQAILQLGSWLHSNRLGSLTGEAFTMDTEAANRYFQGRFTAFQQAIAALQSLNEIQFIHEHNRVQNLINDLCQTFCGTYGDYVLLGDDLTPVPMEEFLRKAQAGICYYIGAVLDYKH